MLKHITTWILAHYLIKVSKDMLNPENICQSSQGVACFLTDHLAEFSMFHILLVRLMLGLNAVSKKRVDTYEAHFVQTHVLVSFRVGSSVLLKS